ncbi:Bis(5'-nucleosyl)-tetraphosphatase PrpE [asymmetrical] [Roseivivax jejudonensis]|uniref:Bis(5'-nucleosyl)-tetraphosphatase PrpE [asymmetrical] n=1 Tax=Roseivivax jejudonensis TaxID=1529041 RepID=A0A1X7AAA7_9RHOB|nr:metallophosphoesterase [Roseivivax jejudonensis]SLN74219.1 Bis(5'-nucleosyl)-tetraphosphatase PrpE [asymmetrical] [Roseivivax jejudonensis]
MALRAFFGRAQDEAERPLFGPIRPDRTLTIIGDVHGSFEALDRLLPKLPQEGEIVFVGDLIDRGERSAEVLDLVAGHDGVTVLKGNHEQLLLDFLADPARHGRRWLRYGGLQTCASYGLSDLSLSANSDQLERARDALAQRMGAPLLRWLSGLPSSLTSGNVTVLHAGADPRRAIEEQDESVLLWGHPEFHREARTDGMWVVHGHTIVNAPSIADGRIAVDTGAYATGRLTALVLSRDVTAFISS